MMLALSRNKDAKASAPYLTRLKLSRSPFSAAVDEDAFFADPSRAQQLDMLQHLTQYSDELLLISGARGSGKSTLLERFLARAEEHWRSCRVAGGEQLGADQLFSRIADCFQLDLAAASDNLLDGLKSQLEALQEQQLPVLLVDDAQALSDDALEMVMHLAALEGEHGKLIRVILFADETLDARLGGERFAGMPRPHRQEMQGLDEQGVGAYIGQRLAAAGYSGQPLFDARELKQIQRESAGLPGRINDLAHAMLLEKLAEERPRGDAKRYLKMGIAASAVIGTVLGLHERINLLLGGEPRAMTVQAPERPVVRLAEGGNPWAVVIRDGESIQISCGAPQGETVGVRPVLAAAAGEPIMRDISPGLVAAPEPAAKPPAEAPAQKASGQQGAEEPDAAPGASGETQETEKAPNEPVQVAAREPAEKPLVVKQEQSQPDKPAEPAAGEALQLQQVEPSPVPGSSTPQRLILKGSGFMPGSKVAVSHAGKVKVLPAQQVEFIDSGTMAITITPGLQRSDWAAQISTPANQRSNVLRFQVVPPANDAQQPAASPTQTPPVAEKAPPSAEKPVKQEKAGAQQSAAPAPRGQSTPPSGLQGYDWYAAQPATHYTLQLLASENRSNLESYLQAQQIPAPVGMFAMQQKGKTLYALTQGSYRTRAMAQKAAAALPTGSKPWIRSMESVQRVMQRPQPQAKQVQPVRSTARDERFRDTAWVWSQDPSRFTLQLAAAGSEQAIEAQMRRISLPGELSVVQTVRNGRPWYVLIYGSFESKAAARGTIERMPMALKQAGPWPRSFASLQDAMSRATPAN